MENILAEYRAIEEKAKLLKTLGHPVRLCIVRGLLVTGSCNVTKIQTCLQLPQSTISQHLARLREAGIVATERVGVEVFYRIASDDAMRLVKALFSLNMTKEQMMGMMPEVLHGPPPRPGGADFAGHGAHDAPDWRGAHARPAGRDDALRG
ncbi:MAG: metalloregulator ArsR/SmtB family transcription factor [Bacillota bacterium]